MAAAGGNDWNWGERRVAKVPVGELSGDNNAITEGFQEMQPGDNLGLWGTEWVTGKTVNDSRSPKGCLPVEADHCGVTLLRREASR